MPGSHTARSPLGPLISDQDCRVLPLPKKALHLEFTRQNVVQRRDRPFSAPGAVAQGAVGGRASERASHASHARACSGHVHARAHLAHTVQLAQGNFSKPSFPPLRRVHLVFNQLPLDRHRRARLLQRELLRRDLPAKHSGQLHLQLATFRRSTAASYFAISFPPLQLEGCKDSSEIGNTQKTSIAATTSLICDLSLLQLFCFSSPLLHCTDARDWSRACVRSGSRVGLFACPLSGCGVDTAHALVVFSHLHVREAPYA